MDISVGIGLAFITMLSWGFGDFLIQRSTRKIGNWETLFLISLFGTIVLLPFVFRDLPELFSSGNGLGLVILSVAGLVLFAAALLDFEALRVGKISVVEPMWSFEIPIAGFFAFFFLGEKLSVLQILFVVILIVGLILVSFKEKHTVRTFLMEKGVVIAFFAGITMGAANFFIGWGARQTDPLMVNFFVNFLIFLGTAFYLFSKGCIGKAFKDSLRFRAVVLPMVVLDNSAWISFAFAMSLAPIGIVVALSESYIALAAILGLVFNKEKLQRHQKFGLLIAFIFVILLAVSVV